MLLRNETQFFKTNIVKENLWLNVKNNTLYS